MKKLIVIACSLGMTLSACASTLPMQSPNPAPAPAASASATTDSPLGGLGNLLGGMGGNKSTESSDNGSGSGLGSLLGNVVSGLLGTDKISPDRLVGTWNYVSPAVCFKSENFLQKAGGAAMAATIENKLSGYYDKFGLNKVTLTVDEQQNFKMNLGLLRTSGTVTIDGEDVYFNFTALGAIKLGKMKTYVTMAGNKQMSLMFDVSQLLSIVKAVGSMSKSGSISAVSSLLTSYDGLCAGFKLNKQ